MKKVLLLALPVLAAAALFGSVTAAQATPVSRANAVRSAKEYLHSQAFSFKGLVSQLKYEGFSRSDATYGVSHSGANWYKQAAKSAKQYLRTQAFSRRGLVEQLEYEGYTHSQALYGVRAAGL
jgi:Host cell surface-exposed lipoprotein